MIVAYSEPKPTFLGIAVLVAAAVAMPWLAERSGGSQELRAVLR